MWNLEKWYRETYLQSGNRETDVESKVRDTKAGNEHQGRKQWLGELGAWD